MALVKHAEVILLLTVVHSYQEVRSTWTVLLLRIYHSAIFIYSSAFRIHQLTRAQWEQGILRFAGWRLPAVGPFTIFHALESGNYILLQAQNSALASGKFAFPTLHNILKLIGLYSVIRISLNQHEPEIS